MIQEKIMAKSERILPHNRDAEQSVLGAAMLSRESLSDVLEIVRPDDFYDPAHKEIFRVMSDLFRESVNVDIVTVCDELKKRNSLEAAGGRAYVASLSSEVPSAANAAGYARIVAEKSSLRMLISASDDIREKAFGESDDPTVLLDHAEQKIFEIAQRRQSRDYMPISEVLVENMNMIDKAIQAGGKVTGLTTGYKELDSETSGLQKSNLIIIAARPAMGKTAFALNIALNAAKKADATVLIFSLEMAKAELSQRLLSMESRVEMQKLKTGDIKNNDWERLALAYDSLGSTNINIDDTPGVSIMEMKNKCRRLKAEKGLDLVVVDYLQLMQGDGRTDNRQQEISAFSRQLKLLAREMDCPVIVLSQLSRGPEQRTDHRPVLSDLRESGAIEQDADIVMFLYRDDYYNENTDKPGICEVNIAKHRSGAVGRIELAWVARYTMFSDKA